MKNESWTLVLALPLAAAIFVVVKYDEITDVMANDEITRLWPLGWR